MMGDLRDHAAQELEHLREHPEDGGILLQEALRQIEEAQLRITALKSTLADINDLLNDVTVQHGSNVHHILQAHHLALQALGRPVSLSYEQQYGRGD